MNILICEDESYWIDTIQAAVSEWALAYKQSVQCMAFRSPKEMLAHLATYKDFDVVLLDILLGNEEIDGMAVAKQIRKMGRSIPIIFITSDSIRASDGYLVEAIGFLDKPLDRSKLIFFLNKVVERQKGDKIIKLAAQGTIVNVRLRDVVYAEIDNHTVVYHTVKENISLRGTLTDIFALLGEQGFLQVHRSYVIAKDRIYSIKTTSPYSIYIMTGQDTINLPVSRKYIETLLKTYSDDILEKML